MLTVSDYNPKEFYLPVEMATLPAVVLLEKHGSVKAALRAQLKRTPRDEEIKYFWLKFCEERYIYDFEFYAISCITIRDKETGEDIRFKLNRAQRRLLGVLERQRKEGRQINVQVLKAKQMGFSTLIQMYMKWIQTVHRRNWNSVVCAHILTAAVNIRSMYDNSVALMPPINGEKLTIGSFAGLKNIKEIPQRGCRITVGTAVEPESVRSQDIKMVHFSEMAFYPTTENNNPEMLESSIISSLTDGPDTMIVRESTANGEGDYFHQQWLKAKQGETAYEAFFAPWFEIPLYEELFNGRYYMHNGRTKRGTMADFIATMNEYEWNLWNNHTECTLENLNWRRKRRATMPSEWKMKQEFPSNDTEAFQSLKNPVFNPEHVEALRKDSTLPESVGDLVSRCAPEIAVIETKRRREVLQDIEFVVDDEATNAVKTGEKPVRFARGKNKIHVWEFPDTSIRVSNRYLVVFDPQRGTSDTADYGVIKVFDRYWMMYGEEPEVVALYYGHKDKDVTIWMAAQIAKWYNDALLVVESNTYDSDSGEDESEHIFETIKEYYTNLYSRTSPDKIREGAPVKYGFNTNRNTKPMIITNYKGIIRERGYVERDEGTVDEALVFEEKENGKTGAKDGMHDDRIMATMIGLYVCYKMDLPAEIKPVSHAPVKRTAW